MTLSTVGPGPYRASLALALVLGFPTWLLNRPQAEPISHPLSPHHTEIIERVTRGEQPPFRPSLALQSHLEELGQLMQRCWAEDPQERPPFQQIRLMLRKFNRSLALVLGRPSLLHPRQPPCIPHLSNQWRVTLQEVRCRVKYKVWPEGNTTVIRTWVQDLLRAGAERGGPCRTPGRGQP